MKKNKIIAAFAIVAIVLTILTCYLIYHYLSPNRGTIYVFKSNYPAGTQLTKDMLAPVQVDSTITVAGGRGKIEDQFVTPSQYQQYTTSGDSLRMDVAAGMPLTPSMLSQIGGSSVEMNMQPSSVAVTISVDAITGVTNELKPGSRVNIYTAMDSGIRLILQNMRILATYYSGDSLYGVSVETTKEESMQLIYAASYGSIYLGLVDMNGYQAEEDASKLFFSGVEAYGTNPEKEESSNDMITYQDILDAAQDGEETESTESTPEETELPMELDPAAGTITADNTP